MKLLFLDDPMVSNIVFYPRKASIPTNLPPHIKVLKFEVNEEITIGGLLYLKDPNLPTILMFHGNGEISHDYQYFYALYFENGVNLAVADFRGYGFSTGQPIYTSLITDAMPIYTGFKKYLEENNMNPSHFVKGRSLGSVCSSEIGSHNPEGVKGIIFESGFADIYRLITGLFRIQGPGIDPETLKEYSNHVRIEKFNKPVLIIHGTRDWIIPSEQAHLIYHSIPENVDKTLVLIEGAGHNDIFNYIDEYFPPLKDFIDKYK